MAVWLYGGCNHASQLLKCAAFMDSIPLLIMIVAETVSLSALARLIPSRVYPFVKITSSVAIRNFAVMR